MHLFVVKFTKMLNNSLLNGLIFSQQLYIDEYYFKMHFLKKIVLLLYYKCLFIGCKVKKRTL